MKKKVLILSIAMILLLTGVVSAASSYWGVYKGNDIIRLTVNGTPVKVSDVPAISYQGRTMVPIYLLKQAGVSYTWNQEEQTVDVTKSAPPADSYTDSQVLYMKALFKLTNHYTEMQAVGDIILGAERSLSTGYSSIREGFQKDYYVGKSREAVDYAISQYNKFLSEDKAQSKFAASYNINIEPKSTEIFNIYYSAIEHLKSSLYALESYAESGNISDAKTYLDSLDLFIDEIYKGIEKASNQTAYYGNLALQY